MVLVDASETISEQEPRVIQQVIDAGRALVIAYVADLLTQIESAGTSSSARSSATSCRSLGAVGQRLGPHRSA